MCLAVCLPYWPRAHGYFDKGNNASQEVISWWFESIWQLCHCIYFASDASTWVLYLQICQPVYPLLLENAHLQFCCFGRICRMGRAERKFVGSGCSESQFIFVHIGVGVSHWQKLIFTAANCIRHLGQVYWFIPWEYTYGCVLPPVLYKQYIK